MPILKKQAIGAMELLLTALIWGVAFVAQSVGMQYIGPYTFNCVRFFYWWSCSDSGNPIAET